MVILGFIKTEHNLQIVVQNAIAAYFREDYLESDMVGISDMELLFMFRDSGFSVTDTFRAIDTRVDQLKAKRAAQYVAVNADCVKESDFTFVGNITYHDNTVIEIYGETMESVSQSVGNFLADTEKSAPSEIYQINFSKATDAYRKKQFESALLRAEK